MGQIIYLKRDYPTTGKIAYPSRKETIYQPIANWKVDNGNARFLDYAGSYNPIYDGNTVTEINGFGGQKALKFNNFNGQPVDIGDISIFSTPSFSVCAWIYIDSTHDSFTVIAGKYADRRDNPSSSNATKREWGLICRTDTQQLLFQVQDSDGINHNAIDSINYTENTWIFITGILDINNLKLKLIINGAFVTETSLPSGFTLITTDSELTLGGGYIGYPPNVYTNNFRMFSGAIQQVLFFNQAINQDTIDYWYNNGNGRF